MTVLDTRTGNGQIEWEGHCVPVGYRFDIYQHLGRIGGRGVLTSGTSLASALGVSQSWLILEDGERIPVDLTAGSDSEWFFRTSSLGPGLDPEENLSAVGPGA